MPTLRFASVDARSFARDRVAVSAALSAIEPHVAVVHHAPHLGRWRTQSSTIARSAGLVVVGGGRQAGANLLLSSLAVDFVSTTDVPFRRVPLRPAGAVVARLRRGPTRLAVAGVSFSADAVGSDAAVLRAALSEVAGLPLVASVVGSAATLGDLGTLVGGRVLVGPSVGVGEVETGNVVVVELKLPES